MPRIELRTSALDDMEIGEDADVGIGPGAPVGRDPQFACFNLLDRLDRNGRMGLYDGAATPTFEPDGFFNGVFQYMQPRVYRGGVRITF